MEKTQYSAESHANVKAEENWASTTHQYQTSSNHRAPFMDELKEEFDKAYYGTTKLDKLLARIRIFETFMPHWIPTRANYDLAA